ncbi:MAG: hypothetical protein KC777_16150 [Cyanobacteria bacterium HKST-UBA02]|nr:hypothetical protein [Cyanobacteria bacterium HKST-UBA02]
MRKDGPNPYFPAEAKWGGGLFKPDVRPAGPDPYYSPPEEGKSGSFFEGVAWGLSVPVLLGATLDMTFRNWKFPCARAVLRFYGHSAWTGARVGGRATLKGCQVAGKYALPAARRGVGLAAHFVDEIKRAAK